jgi:predicted methyltransferase
MRGSLLKATLLAAAVVATAVSATPATSGPKGPAPAPTLASDSPGGGEAPGQRAERRRGRRSAERREEIERTIEVLGLEAGKSVAEVGAGDGRFSLAFAEVVGAGGRVYANELDSDDVARIRRRAEEEGFGNLVAVQGAVDDTNLPDGCCDALMMRMVYHMLTDPTPMSRSFYEALKPGGVLAILEGDPEPGQDNARGVPANRAGMGIDPEIVIEEITAIGFELERRISDWTGADYALVFRKPHARD